MPNFPHRPQVSGEELESVLRAWHALVAERVLRAVHACEQPGVPHAVKLAVDEVVSAFIGVDTIDRAVMLGYQLEVTCARCAEQHDDVIAPS